MNTPINGWIAICLILTIGGWIVLTRLGEGGPRPKFCAGMFGQDLIDCENK